MDSLLTSYPPRPGLNPNLNHSDYLSDFSFDLMMATSILPDDTYVRDANGVTYRVQRVNEADPTITTTSLTTNAGTTPRDIPSHATGTTQRRALAPTENYSHLVSANFANQPPTAYMRQDFHPQASQANLLDVRQHGGTRQPSDPQPSRLVTKLPTHAEYDHCSAPQVVPMKTYSQSSESTSSGTSQHAQLDTDQSTFTTSPAPQHTLHYEWPTRNYYGVPLPATMRPHAQHSISQPQLIRRPVHQATQLSHSYEQPMLESTSYDSLQRQIPVPSVNQCSIPTSYYEHEVPAPSPHTFSADQLHNAQYALALPSRRLSSSSGTPSIRDSVAPGERLIYESTPRSLTATNIPGGDYHEATLRIFHDEARKEMRVFMQTGLHTDSHTMPEVKARLVPHYAYSTSNTNIISIHDNGDYASNNQSPISRDPLTSALQPLWLLKFASIDQLVQFQSRITGEEVVLDISSIRSFKMNRQGSNTKETFSGGIRIQMWHETRSGRRTATSGASIVSNGTMLSAPLKERTTLSASKLMVYLGRTESYFMAYITDDIELVRNSRDPCILKLRPKNYDIIHMTRSRSRVHGKIEKRSGGRLASLQVLGHAINPDQQEEFPGFKSLTLEFENESNQLTFAARWKELIRARRSQRQELGRIQEDMAREGLNAHDAMKIRM